MQNSDKTKTGMKNPEKQELSTSYIVVLCQKSMNITQRNSAFKNNKYNKENHIGLRPSHYMTIVLKRKYATVAGPLGLILKLGPRNFLKDESPGVSGGSFPPDWEHFRILPLI